MFSVVLTAVLLAPAEKPAATLLAKAVKEGIAIPGGPPVKMPAPYMRTGITPAEQKKVLARFIDEEGDRFTDPVGSHSFKESPLPNPKQPGHIISVAFVAYGKLSDLQKRGLVDELLGLNKKGTKAVVLTTAELASRKLILLPKSVADESYTLLDANLIDRVQLTGVMHNLSYKTKGQLTAVGILDERFLNDKTYPNRYRKLEPGGEAGPAVPYSGLGGYVRVTELAEPTGALFIEMHFLYHEPKDWFNGKSVLVPKLRVGVKNNIVTVRRSLKKARGVGKRR